MNRSLPILALAATLGLGGCPEVSHDDRPAALAIPAGSRTITATLPYAAAPGESPYALTTARLTP